MVIKGKIMKKIIMFLCLAVFIIPTYAVDMCVSDDTVAVVLDPNVAIDSRSYDDAKSEWRANAGYGTVVGVSACIGTRLQWTYTTYDGVLQVNNNVVVGGERTGESCWCKITHPVVSKWVYICEGTSCGTGTPCAVSCTYACSNVFKDNRSEIRKLLFGSVTN